jgi:hypothetical protein
MARMNSLHIFRAGTHIDGASGKPVTLTAADIVASAAAYDPIKHEAPIVIGHPDDTAPAYGWAKSLTASGENLNAEPQQVNPAFAELFNAGSYKKISSSFYAPDAANNPVPGVWYLRHIGVLGAVPPAVKGLQQASFSDKAAGVVEFADWSLDTQASLWRRMRDFLIGDKGQEVADQVIPDYAINDLRDAARQSSEDDPQNSLLPFNLSPAFSETENTVTTLTAAQQAELQADNQRLARELAESRARETQRVTDARHTANVAFAEVQITAGRLAPKDKDTVVAFLNFCETPDAKGGVVSFGEGDAKKPLVDGFKAFLAELPKVVEFQEIAGKGRVDPDIGKNVNPLVADAERRNQQA